jgi:Domain of unknown function (DUF4157)
MSEHQVESADKAALHRRVAQTDATPSHASGNETAHPLLRLQSQVGNAQIARMIAQRQAMEEPEEGAGQLAQRQAAEEPEEGAAQIAQRQAAEEPEEGAAQIAQRQAAEEPEEGAGLIQAKAEVGLAGGPLNQETEARIQSQRGSGAALESTTRATMEQSFGTSFDDVRVHSDGESHALNRTVSARAFTTGNDIFLGAHASPADSRLLAHELTHVVQQRSMSGGGALTVGAAGDQHEQHADQVADVVTSQAAATAHAAPGAQREADEAATVQRVEEPEENAGAAEIQPPEEEAAG